MVYKEVDVGISLIRRRRKIDLLVTNRKETAVLGIECKYQLTPGTAEEKIISTFTDLKNLRIPAIMAYAGPGFSRRMRAYIEASPLSAFFYPPSNLGRVTAKNPRPDSPSTWQIDLSLALTFQWFDIITKGYLDTSAQNDQIASYYNSLTWVADAAVDQEE